MLRVFSRCSINRRVQMLRLRLLAFSYTHKAPANNTPETKIASSSVSLKPCLLRVLLQLHFGVVADRFLLVQQVAQQKSATKVYVCYQSYCYRRSSVVCRCVCLYVCLSVCHDSEPCKTAAPIEMPLDYGLEWAQRTIH